MVHYWRLISPEYNDPYTNMAIDEAILEGYLAGIVPPTFRIYGWKPAGISLGYFQKTDEVLNINNCQEQGIPFVRRLSGGEAIFHNKDVSYSIVCSTKDLFLPKLIKSSFKVLASFLINSYKTLGLKPCFFSEIKSKTLEESHSSFCFAMRRDFDITIDGKKIGGNAQKRRKDIIFQHGSIPLKFDTKKIKLLIRENLKGVEEKTIDLKNALGRKILFDEFASLLIDSFRKTFSVNLVNDKQTHFELKIAKILRKEKYANKEWNLAKTSLVKQED